MANVSVKIKRRFRISKYHENFVMIILTRERKKERERLFLEEAYLCFYQQSLFNETYYTGEAPPNYILYRCGRMFASETQTLSRCTVQRAIFAKY